MCNFFSALVKYRGQGEFELLHKLGTVDHDDHHSILASHFKINEDNVARIEYKPEGTGFVFVLDEEREPSWWTEDIKIRVEGAMHGALAEYYDLQAHENGTRPIESDGSQQFAEVGGSIWASGAINLSGCTLPESLQFPQAVGGPLRLRGCTLPRGLKFPQTVVGSLDLSYSILPEGLELPETVVGPIYLSYCTIPEGLVLPKNVGSWLYLDGAKNSYKLAEKAESLGIKVMR